MAWTATIVEKAFQGDRVEVAVGLSDGTMKFVQRYTTNGTLANLRAQVLSTVASQDARKTKDDLVIGQAINTTPDAPVTPVDPTPNRTQWAKDYQRFQRLQRAVAAGLISASAKAVTDQTALVKSTWDPTYEDLL